MKSFSTRGAGFSVHSCAVAILVSAVFAGVAQAQVGRDSIPSTVYFASFDSFYDGDFRDAAADFQNTLGGGIKSPAGRWIDAICYHTMFGESLYQLGNMPAALDQYNFALRQYVAYYDWMLRAQFPPVIQPGAAGSRVAVPWGQTKRTASIGQFPSTMMMSQGQVNNNSVIQQGGVVQSPVLFPVHVSEIVRCTALAMRRRRELMGPVCKHDPLTTELVTVLSRRPAPQGSWAEAWIDVLLGAAYAGAGNPSQAAASFQRSLIVQGEYDHPLTATALFELGRMALEAGNFNDAARLFEETTYTAVNFNDPALLEEAFRYGQMTHLLSNQKGVYPPLASAMTWARLKGLRALQVSLELLAAENMAVLGTTPAAVTLLNDARANIGNRSMAKAAIGARLNYLTALTAYQLSNVPAGDLALKAALDYQKIGSIWLFQIGLADRLHLSGELNSDRVAMNLYETLLRDPTPADWATNPMESLSVLTTPHLGPMENWFDVTLRRNQENELALEVADRCRRHRFFSTLPFGGRLTALRWILEAPADRLTEQSKLEKQDILVRYPRYAELADQARKIRTDLLAKPLVEEDAAAKRQQSNTLASLITISQAQEVILREIALRREPSELIFPPLRKTKDVQLSLQPGQLLLTFFSTGKNLHAFLFSREKYAQWKVTAPLSVQRNLTQLLRDLGNFEQNYQLSQHELTGGAWQKSAAKVSDAIFDKSNVDLSVKFDELIVVPDDILWYVPFEVLPVGKGDKTKPLLSHVKVRYAPTVGLATPYTRSRKPKPKIGVVVGRLYPHDDDAVARAAFDSFSHSVPDALALPNLLPAASSLYRTFFDQMVVLDDIEPSDAGPYEWSPAQLDRGKPGSSLSAWFALPYGGPDQILLPGYHSAAESPTKKLGVKGQDLFLSVCGLMSAGARTVLISRWRTGGQTSFELMREFAQELPHTTPADAWQRSVQIVSDQPLDPESEPRLKRFAAESATPKAQHPFFWSGYMLVDSGILPDKETEPAAPALNFKDKQAAAGGAKPPAIPLIGGPAMNGGANPPPLVGGDLPPDNGKPGKKPPVRPAIKKPLKK